jgi:hypothetical protein
VGGKYALRLRDVHPDDDSAGLQVFVQTRAGTLQRGDLAARHYDGQAPRQQLAARLEAKSAIRTGDERNALLCTHRLILLVRWLG